MDIQTRKPIGLWLRGKIEKRQHAEGFEDCDHALCPDGQRLLQIRNGLASVQDITTGKNVERTLQHGGGVQSVAFSPDGTRALTVGKEGDAHVWDSGSWRPLIRIEGKSLDSLEFGGFSPDNRYLLARWGDWARGLRDLGWWDVESGQLLRDLSGKGRFVQWCSWRPDGRQELRISRRGDVMLRNSSSGAGLSLPQGRPVTVATYAPDGRVLLTAGEDAEVRIWDLCAREEQFTLKAPGKDDFNTDIRRAIHVYFNERIMQSWYEAVGFDGEVDTVTGSVGYRWPATENERIQRLLPSGTPVDRGALAPDQSRVVTVSEFPGPSDASIQLRADKVRSAPLIQSLQLWDPLTGGRVGKRLDSDQTFTYVTFSPDNRMVAVAHGYGDVSLVNATTGEPLGTPLNHGAMVFFVAFSPNGELLATCGADQKARFWRTKTGEPAGELHHGGWITCAAFSPNGEMAATASRDGTVRLWDIKGQTPMGALDQKNGYPEDIAFDPSSSLLVVGMTDEPRVEVAGICRWTPLQRIRIWDLASQREVSPAIENPNDDVVPPMHRSSSAEATKWLSVTSSKERSLWRPIFDRWATSSSSASSILDAGWTPMAALHPSAQKSCKHCGRSCGVSTLRNLLFHRKPRWNGESGNSKRLRRRNNVRRWPSPVAGSPPRSRNRAGERENVRMRPSHATITYSGFGPSHNTAGMPTCSLRPMPSLRAGPTTL